MGTARCPICSLAHMMVRSRLTYQYAAYGARRTLPYQIPSVPASRQSGVSMRGPALPTAITSFRRCVTREASWDQASYRSSASSSLITTTHPRHTLSIPRCGRRSSARSPFSSMMVTLWLTSPVCSTTLRRALSLVYPTPTGLLLHHHHRFRTTLSAVTCPHLTTSPASLAPSLRHPRPRPRPRPLLH